MQSPTTDDRRPTTASLPLLRAPLSTRLKARRRLLASLRGHVGSASLSLDGVVAMNRILCTMLAAAVALPSVALAQSNSSDPVQNPISSSLKNTQQRYERNLVGSAESMPAEKYN